MEKKASNAEAQVLLYSSWHQQSFKAIIFFTWEVVSCNPKKKRKRKEMKINTEILSGGGPCQKGPSHGRKCCQVRFLWIYMICQVKILKTLYLFFVQIWGATCCLSYKSGQDKSRGWQAPKGDFKTPCYSTFQSHVFVIKLKEALPNRYQQI